jgi:hypothetical protein
MFEFMLTNTILQIVALHVWTFLVLLDISMIMWLLHIVESLSKLTFQVAMPCKLYFNFFNKCGRMKGFSIFGFDKYSRRDQIYN